MRPWFPGFRCAPPGAIFCRLLRRLVELLRPRRLVELLRLRRLAQLRRPRRLVELLLHQDFSVSLVNSGALDQPAKDFSTVAQFGTIAFRFRKHLEESGAR